MNKNVVIGILVVVVLIGLGFYVSKNKVVITPANDTVTPSTKTTTQNTSAKSGAPVVETSSETGTSSSTATVSGHVKPNGASTAYWFEYGETTALGNRTTKQALGSGFSSIPTTGFITGLRANRTYYFRLSAENTFATVNGEMLSFQTNNNTPPKAVAPTARTNSAANIGKNMVTINGEVNPNGSPTNYWFEYGTDTNFGFVTAFQATNSGTSFMSVPASISGLEPLTKYYFRLNAQNQFGTVNGGTMNFTTSGPVSGTKPEVQTSGATSISSSDAVFTGHINPNGAETTYWFEYSNDSLLNSLIGSGTPQRTLGPSTTNQAVQINVNGLSSNTKYYYHLVGKNQYGTVYGDTVSFTTKR